MLRNPITFSRLQCCFAMEYLKGQDHTIEKPEEYDVLARLRPEAPAALARQAPELGDDPSDNSGKACRWRSTLSRPNPSPGSL